MKIKTLSIDFDDTIVENAYPNIGLLRKDAKKIVNKLYSEGYYIIINTCRAGKYELQAELFLFQQGINFHRINENSPASRLFFDPDCRKISADFYIDDKNINGLPSWEEIYDIVTKRFNGKATS